MVCCGLVQLNVIESNPLRSDFIETVDRTPACVVCVRFMSDCAGLVLYRSKSMHKMKIDRVIIYFVVEKA